MGMVTLAGIDLAWLSRRNPTAIAWGSRTPAHPGRGGTVRNRGSQLDSGPPLSGVAVDAPLIIENQSGSRLCEKEIGRVYGARKASCHPSNLERYPDADSVELALWLERAGHQHLGRASGKWQLECYPHPAIIEIFGLPERHLYKKGKVETRKNGQVRFAQLILGLAQSPVLKLLVSPQWGHYFSEQHIRSLRGQALKHNEDILDSVLCLYIAGLYHLGITEKVDHLTSRLGNNRGPRFENFRHPQYSPSAEYSGLAPVTSLSLLYGVFVWRKSTDNSWFRCRNYMYGDPKLHGTVRVSKRFQRLIRFLDHRLDRPLVQMNLSEGEPTPHICQNHVPDTWKVRLPLVTCDHSRADTCRSKA